MAVTATFAESFIIGLFSGTFNLPSDSLKLALMSTSFEFDAESDSTWADISSDEITAGNGYTDDGIALTGVAVAVSGTAGDGIVNITCTNNPTWTASGGAISTTGAAALIDHTVSTPRIILVIDFDADYATADGKMFQVNLSNGVGSATIVIPATEEP